MKWLKIGNFKRVESLSKVSPKLIKTETERAAFQTVKRESSPYNTKTCTRHRVIGLRDQRTVIYVILHFLQFVACSSAHFIWPAWKRRMLPRPLLDSTWIKTGTAEIEWWLVGTWNIGTRGSVTKSGTKPFAQKREKRGMMMKRRVEQPWNTERGTSRKVT